MNNSTAVFLINKDVRAVLTIYEAETPHSPTAKRAMFKTLDQTIKAGDFVVVPTETRHKMTVVKVVEVDVEVDFESPVQVGWIIGTVERIDYEETLKRETAFIEAVKAAEKRKKQDELREALLKVVPVDEIKLLPITAMDAAEPAAPSKT